MIHNEKSYKIVIVIITIIIIIMLPEKGRHFNIFPATWISQSKHVFSIFSIFLLFSLFYIIMYPEIKHFCSTIYRISHNLKNKDKNSF